MLKVMLFLLVCIGLLADNNRYKVSALRNREFFFSQTQGDKERVQLAVITKLKSIDFHFRLNREDQGMFREKHRMLGEVNKNKDKALKMQEHKNKANNSFKSSKRRVRRGSDPIHNKSQPFS